MVKKLVSGILKRGKKEDVPDELPPLTADSGRAPEAHPAEKPDATETQAEPEVPDELPAIEPAKPEPALPKEPVISPAPEQPDTHLVATAETPAPHPAPPAEMHEPMEVPRPDTQEGFFRKLDGLIKTQKSDKVMSQNLLSSMKESYSIRKEAVKTGLDPTEEKRLKHTIDEVLATLKLLEGKWRAQRLVMDEDEKQLREYETQIADNEKQLKSLLKHYTIYETKPDATLVLKNYIEVRNISDLYNALRLLDQPTFSRHVGRSKNDFADFVQHFDGRLAGKLRKSRSKKKALAVLHEYIERNKSE